MRWKNQRRSTNVEDRRGGGLPGGRGATLGCGGLLLVIVFSVLTGQDPQMLLDVIGGSQATVQQPAPSGSPGAASGTNDTLSQFASVVLADTEDTWRQLFTQMGSRYQEPTLVLFSGSVRSACGMASAAVGPFYCPADREVYLDLSFFDEMARRLGAPGDFAQAYVIAHEVAHHVQNLTGISDQVQRAQQSVPKSQANELSVRLELQADCLAGVWAHHAHRERQLLEPGDVEEGLRAAAAIGDDQLQRQAGGQVRPESWTHGSSEQRVRWLQRGLESGDPDSCDTFEQRSL